MLIKVRDSAVVRGFISSAHERLEASAEAAPLQLLSTEEAGGQLTLRLSGGEGARVHLVACVCRCVSAGRGRFCGA